MDMDINWGSLFGALGGGVMAGVSAVFVAYKAWRHEKDRDFQRWAARLGAAICQTATAAKKYTNSPGRHVMTDIAFNFLRVHDEAALGAREGFTARLRKKDEEKAKQFDRLQELADEVLHTTMLPAGGLLRRGAVALDSIPHAKREYAIAKSDLRLEAVAKHVRDGIDCRVTEWEEMAGWLERL